MRGKETSLAERLSSQAKAKQELLARARAKSPVNDPDFLERKAAREAAELEREARLADRRATKEAEAARLAAERAAAEAARLEAEKASEEERRLAAIAAAEEAERLKVDQAEEAERLKVDQKAKRDQRYAARKARQR